MSTDHTWIQEALERGLIQPDQVNGHPNAHVIRRYLGAPTPPEVDFRIRLPGLEETASQGLQLLPGDRLLLCSDGLTDLVKDDEILAAFDHGTLEDAGQRLVDMANARGGHDNITLVIVQVPDPVAATMPVAVPARRAFSRRVLAGCAAVIMLAALVGAVAGGWALLGGVVRPTQTPTQTVQVVPTQAATRTRTNTPFQTRTPTFTLFPSTPTDMRAGTATPSGPVATVTPVRLLSPTSRP